jgi:hypothetical protein
MNRLRAGRLAWTLGNPVNVELKGKAEPVAVYAPAAER